MSWRKTSIVFLLTLGACQFSADKTQEREQMRFEKFRQETAERLEREMFDALDNRVYGRPDFGSGVRQYLRPYGAEKELTPKAEAAIEAYLRDHPDDYVCRLADEARPAVLNTVPDVCKDYDRSGCQYSVERHLDGTETHAKIPGSCPVGHRLATLLGPIQVSTEHNIVALRELPADVTRPNHIRYACVDFVVEYQKTDGVWSASSEQRQVSRGFQCQTNYKVVVTTDK